MKSLVELTVLVLQDCGTMCGASPARDLITITSRSKMEGESFVTITLPAFCRGFERSLDEGRLSPSHFPGFRFRKDRCLPRFLAGFTERIFDRDGVLLDEPDSDCIFSVRQICLLQKKVKLPCTKARELAAESNFIKVEVDLKNHVYDNALLHTFGRVADIMWTDILRGVPFGDPYDEYRPRHGPGTTVEGLRGNSKFTFPTWPKRLESEFPISDFGCASILNPESVLTSGFLEVAPRDESPVRVVFVPKTLKTPRVIGIEPVCMQYIQQAISGFVTPKIEKSSVFTSGHVNFTDQRVNGNLALQASRIGHLATIDLSEASDRVSCGLVWLMLRSQPTFRRQVFSCRSTRAKLPSGRNICLRKFSSMGSALCFPMEAMAFYVAIVSLRIHASGLRVTPKNVLKGRSSVYVYGDDIIVPSDEAPLICEGLKAFALKVNADKSFWTGKFRESCGVEAYDGTDITPVRVNYRIPTDKTNSKSIVATVALANHLYKGGMWRAAKYVREAIEAILGPLPCANNNSQHLGWETYRQGFSANGWSKNLQRLKLRCWVPSPIRSRDIIDGDGAMLKCFQLIGVESVDPKHLLESVRYGNLALKRRWI